MSHQFGARRTGHKGPRSSGTGPASPLQNASGGNPAAYHAPGQDNTRGLYHAWFQEASGDDAGGGGLKEAVSAFENSWYVAAALTMTIGFAQIMFVPAGQHPGSVGDDVALYAYVTLVLFGTINSILGVWWAGHGVPQVSWHPACHFSKYWFASLNTSMGRAQQFAKIALQQLVLSLLPLCYLNFGWVGLALAGASVIYMVLQLQTWRHLSQRMRDTYEASLDTAHHPRPLVDDVRGLSPSQRNPHVEGLLGWLTCQLVSSGSFAFRWLRDAERPWKDAVTNEDVSRAAWKQRREEEALRMGESVLDTCNV
eukprot:g6756.t1